MTRFNFTSWHQLLGSNSPAVRSCLVCEHHIPPPSSLRCLAAHRAHAVSAREGERGMYAAYEGVASRL
jgi:hypothetical protein